VNYLAPAGTPISGTELRAWIAGALHAPQSLESLRTAICDRFQIPHCFFVSSGRAAMTVILRTLKTLQNEPKRTEVIIPGYTCYSVPASIERAGLRVRICDIDPRTLSYDLDQLEAMDFSSVLAVVTANLYGIPNDLLSIERLVLKKGVFLLDDAAQAMGAEIGGRPAGTFGDAGIFSLDKGKTITSVQGGILVTRSTSIANALETAINQLSNSSHIDTLSNILKLLFYAMLLPPKRYGITRYMPFLGLGKTPYTTRYPISRYSPALGAMASLLFTRLAELNTVRTHNARKLVAALADIDRMKPVEAPSRAQPAYVRLPLLIDRPDHRPSLLSALNSAGIGASASYPSAIIDIHELKRYLDPNDVTPNARSIASRVITLPIHPYVSTAHIDRIREVIRSTLS
jgi:perosamine synthetase